jgi:cell division protein FtsN
MELSFHDTLTGRKPMPITQLPDKVEKKQDDVVVVHQEKTPSAVMTPQEEAGATPENASRQEQPAIEKLPVEKKAKSKEALRPDGPSFLIHVASLKEKAKAQQIDKTVAAMGYSSKVVKTDIQGKGTWYRVIATGFDTKAKAQAAADKISKKVKTNCIIRATGVKAEKKS